MAKIETYFDCDLKKAVQVQPLNGNVFSLDNNGNRIGVRIFDNGVKTTVTGTVTGRAILADNSTVNLNGGLLTVNGQSIAYVDVPQGALLIPGTIKITIQLTASGVITTLAAILSTVYQTKTDNVITPSAQVIADWNATISSAIQTQDAAIAAETAAREAADSDLKSALDQNTAGIIDLFSPKTNSIVPALSNGYIDYSTGKFQIYSDGDYKGTEEYIPVVPGSVVKIYAAFNASAGYALYYKNKEYKTGSATNPFSITIPDDVYYIRFSDYKANRDHSSVAFEYFFKETDDVINKYKKFLVNNFLKGGVLVPSLVNGYIDYRDGNYRGYGSGQFKAVTDYIPVIPRKTIYINSSFGGDAGLAFYGIDKSFISGTNTNSIFYKIPDNVYYIRYSSYSSASVHTYVKMIYLYDDKEEDSIVYAQNGIVRFTPSFDTTGYIDSSNGRFSIYGSGEYATTDYIPVTADSFIATNMPIYSYAFYDKDHLFISGSGGSSAATFTIPSTARFFRFTHYNYQSVHTGVNITIKTKIYDDLSVSQDILVAQYGIIEYTPSDLINGYIDYTDGSFHEYGSGDYVCSDFISVHKGLNLNITCTVYGVAGYAFYDNAFKFIASSGGTGSGDIEIPATARYFRFSNVSGTHIHTGMRIKLKSDFFDKYEQRNAITIQCIGDSVTEGMGLDGAHTAEYGKSPYPARLTTLLVDNNYNNVIVTNCGHGGERTPDMAARTGGIACYISEDITVPGDGTTVSLGTPTFVDGRTTGTKVKIAYADENDNDYCVYFTQMSHDTNPVTIDDLKCTMSVSDTTNYIKKVVSDGESTTLKAGSLLFTSDDRNPSVNIIYGGINDGPSLTLERWIDTMKACGEINGGKYIIIGSTHALWENWSDITGTASEKYQKYRRAAIEAFGVHFIDMYKDFFEHAMDYALASGYFTDKTQEEIEEMRTSLGYHIIPKDFAYDKTSWGNVHLSEEGYQVFAMLIFERLKMLNYI